jgi:hypothetical protein
VQLLLLVGQGNQDRMLAWARTRLVAQHHPSGAGDVGRVGYGEDPTVVVMDDVDTPHLRTLVLRASGA